MERSRSDARAATDGLLTRPFPAYLAANGICWFMVVSLSIAGSIHLYPVLFLAATLTTGLVGILGLQLLGELSQPRLIQRGLRDTAGER